MTDASAIVALRRQRVRAALARRLGSVVAVAEAVHRRHNVSAIIRSAEGFGLHEVHLVTGDFRPSRGAARGAERWVELVRHGSTAAAAAALADRGFRLVVADLDAGAWTPDTVPVDRPLAVLFGSEMAGVSDEARALAEGAVCVPMVGMTGSLNVAAAAACILYRVSERRRDWLRAHQGVDCDLPQAAQDAFFDRWLADDEEARRGMVARAALGRDGSLLSGMDGEEDEGA
jgi:tRNA (guanosine-2'-O-)-methyltransferase